MQSMREKKLFLTLIWLLVFCPCNRGFGQSQHQPEDHTVNPGPALEFARVIGAPVVKLDSPCGHLSLSCISVGPTVAQFLASPSSVHSETLKDASGPP